MPKHHAINVYGRMEVRVQEFLASVGEECEWLDSSFGRLVSNEIGFQYPMVKKLDGLCAALVKSKVLSPGSRKPIVQCANIS
jgi:hypothetical protein